MAKRTDPSTNPTASRPKARRRSKLDRFIDLVGKRPDTEVAELAGVTPSNVAGFRRRHGIPAPTGVRPRQGKRALSAEPLERRTGGGTEVASRAAGERPAWRSAFRVRAEGAAGVLSYYVVASTVVQAVKVAEQALPARDGGPWTVVALRRVDDAP